MQPGVAGELPHTGGSVRARTRRAQGTTGMRSRSADLAFASLALGSGAAAADPVLWILKGVKPSFPGCPWVWGHLETSHGRVSCLLG